RRHTRSKRDWSSDVCSSDLRVVTSNLPWVVDAGQLARLLNIDQLALVNDLEANTYGIPSLEPTDFAALNDGAAEATGNIAVIARSEERRVGKESRYRMTT